jgi:3-oxoacyl-[acyl-carrier protein] reductase
MPAERKVVLISGGSRGLGKAMVADLLQAGYVVATFSRSAAPFIEDALARDPAGESFHWEPIDAMSLEDVARFAMAVIRRFGQVDVLINNVAIGLDGLLTLTPPKDIHRAISLNFESVLVLTRTCLKSMIDRRCGCVLNISSVNALRGHSGVSVYSATKAALDGLTRSLAREVGPAGIRVLSLAPGYFQSDMTRGLSDQQREGIVRSTPLRRLGTIAELVAAVRFLISPQASFITGQTLAVDGGLTC